MLTNKTTKKHYEKFKNMAEQTGITFSRSDRYFGYTKQEVLELFSKNEHLNNIPLTKFDSMYLVLPHYTRKIVTNLADNTCLYKHLLIYEVLGATPIFEDS